MRQLVCRRQIVPRLHGETSVFGSWVECAYYNELADARQALSCAGGESNSQMAKLSKPNVAKPDKTAEAPSGLPGKTVEASKSEMVEAVLPNDANSLGAMLGGRVMHFIDIAGALAAHRHSNSHVVTASVDYLDFRFPISVGEFIVLKSSVNRVFHTSMEVGVKGLAEKALTGVRGHTS